MRLWVNSEESILTGRPGKASKKGYFLWTQEDDPRKPPTGLSRASRARPPPWASVLRSARWHGCLRGVKALLAQALAGLGHHFPLRANTQGSWPVSSSVTKVLTWDFPVDPRHICPLGVLATVLLSCCMRCSAQLCPHRYCVTTFMCFNKLLSFWLDKRRFW